MSLVSMVFKRSTGLLHLVIAFGLLLSANGVWAQVDQAQYDNGEKIFKAN